MPSIPALAPSPVEAIHCRRRAFTLVELLVVIGIIAVLISILVPMAFKIQESARAAASQAIVTQIMGACEAYHNDFGAYPGPIPNYAVYAGQITNPGAVTLQGTVDEIKLYNRATDSESTFNDPSGQYEQPRITMAENMVLGLEGGLFRNPKTNNICYDPTLVGTGPRTLGQNLNTAKAYPAYLPTTNLFKASGTVLQFHDDAGTAADSRIPEFVDGFSSPMPILYLRAVKGRTTTTLYQSGNWNDHDNGVITYCVDPRQNQASSGVCAGPYDVSQILAYTGSWHDGKPTGEQNGVPAPMDTTPIGVGRKLKNFYQNVSTPVGTFTPASALTMLPYHGLRTVTAYSVTKLSDATNSTPYFMPMDAFAYFSNPNLQGHPRQENGFILIGAGKDRVYGTEDDQTNFGAVNP